MTLFSENDFSKQLTCSPLAKVIEEALISTHLRNDPEEQGLFLPLPFQTGIGKTYEALVLIFKEILWQIEQSQEALESSQEYKKRTVIYITDSVDNVSNAYEDLIKLIENDERFTAAQKEVLKDQVVYLPRQSGQLRDCPAEDVETIIQTFNLEKNKVINSEWKGFSVLNAQYKKDKKGQQALDKVLGEKGQDLYASLISAIQSRQKGNDPVILSDSQQKALDQLIPGCRFEQGRAHVLFMTTRKYLSGFHHSIGKSRPLRDTKGQLLIIDEVDKQNSEILKAMVDKQAKDLISAVRTLRVNLSRYRLENSPRYAGIEEIFAPLQEELEAFASQWSLDYSYNTEGSTLADQPVRLFSDRTFTHATQTKKAVLKRVDASSVVHQLRLKHDSERRKNLITVEEKPLNTPWEVSSEGKKSHSLIKFVNEADRLYQHFFQKMRHAVNQYTRNIENLPIGRRENRSISGTYQEAVQSILAQYNLQDFSKTVFEAFDAQSLHRRNSPSLPQSRSYHRNGLKLVDISQNEGTRDTVNCHFYGTSQSPTGLIADMVEGGALVVGISATAKASSVIHNFDMPYLKERLGSKFINLTSEQRQAVHDYYVSKRDYEAAGVQVEVQFLNQSDAFLHSMIRDWKPRLKVELFLQSLLPEGVNSTSFLKSWLSKLLQSIKGFIEIKQNRYMLCLCNRTISSASQGKLIEFIRFCMNAWAERNGTEVRLFDGLNAKAMSVGQDKAISKYLQNEKGKVVVFSTYASMGAGKNPDYDVNPENEKFPFIYVGEGKAVSVHSADIDTLFLEKPTNLLLTNEQPIANRLTMFHQIMSLQESGDISPRQASGWSYGVLDNKPVEDSLRLYYSTTDYEAAVRKYIEQAVGRTARTAYKRETIWLYADADLRGILCEDERDTSLLSHEYVALVRKSGAQHGRTRKDDKVTRKLHNLASRNNKDSAQMMKDLVNRLHNPVSERTALDIELWDGMRQQLLTVPTIDNKSECWPRLYLQTPSFDDSDLCGSYRYEGDPDGPLNQYSFFERVTSGKRVSEEDSGLRELLQNSVVSEFFSENDYAMEWCRKAWVMTPVMFTNIYRPALAEQACKALLLDNGFEWHDMPEHLYERFDSIIAHSSIRALLDVKFWRVSPDLDDRTKRKVKEIAERESFDHIVYINVLGHKSDRPRYLDINFTVCSPQKASILEIPGIIDEATGDEIEENIHALMAWLAAEKDFTGK